MGKVLEDRFFFDGQRGDDPILDAMKADLDTVPTPRSKKEFLKILYTWFMKNVGLDLKKEGHKSDAVAPEKFGAGGMSGDWITPSSWVKFFKALADENYPNK